MRLMYVVMAMVHTKNALSITKRAYRAYTFLDESVADKDEHHAGVIERPARVARLDAVDQPANARRGHPTDRLDRDPQAEHGGQRRFVFLDEQIAPRTR